jgi:hypothetical protein
VAVSERTVDEVLAGSSPKFAASTATQAALDELVLEARSTRGRNRGRRRMTWLVPGAVVAVGALTAGAVVADQMTRLEVPISIEYTTDTGEHVSCTAQIASSYFSPRLAEVTEYYRTHRFAAEGIGQRIYEYALVLAGEKEGTAADLPHSVLWLPGDENDGGWEPQSGRSALNESSFAFIVQDVQNELGLAAGRSGAAELQSDCTGRLH